MIRVIGKKGYKAATATDVIEEADVSRAAFYRTFKSKHDCFLAAYDMVVAEIFAKVIANCNGRGSWLERTRAGLATIVGLLALDPAMARTAIVEVSAAGADARRRHWETVSRIAEFLEGGEDLAQGRDLPESTGLMATGAVFGLLFDALQEKRAEQLPDLLPDLIFAMLVPYIGPSAAAAEMRTALTA